ncbi:LysR family transcriptional regulator [Amycolatopsis sp. NBC_01286]|uniref:LysR family transcriptional regulator n=1 Tax=Amycolatopsis sp. NBC_01286 TaxID=2903560 RepID=UPI002E144B2A|nr:LysR family transcriptional regulator [Amycolatopsis sp. NBC_01286]
MNLATLDLNLLVTLDALLQQRSVTRAAEQVGLSQPAVSAQLGRLRRHFHDELLTRVGNTSRLTPLAVQLKERVRVALAGVDRVFTAAADFDPAATTREFSFVVSDYGAAVLGPALATLLDTAAPGAQLRMLANTPRLVDTAEQVLTGIDLLLLPHGFVHGLRHQDLYTDEWVCLVAADNPEVGDTLTAGQLETMPWVVTYHGPTASTPAARQMRMLGIEPRVQIVTESFLAIPGLVAGSGRVALLQRRLADRIPATLGVRALACPFEVSPLLEAMWWHPIHDDDPEHRYLRNLVATAATQISA